MKKIVTALVLGLSLFSLRTLRAEDADTGKPEEAKRQLDTMAAPAEASAGELKPMFDQIRTILDDSDKKKPIEPPKVSAKAPPQ